MHNLAARHRVVFYDMRDDIQFNQKDKNNGDELEVDRRQVLQARHTR